MRQLLALVVLCCFALTSSAIASGDPASSVPATIDGGGPRIRPQNAYIAELLKTGRARSATLRSLAERIEASNVIVYIAVNPLLKSGLSGALNWMTRAGEFRYVRASLSRDLTPDQMIATLAHELQHAAEVAEDATVISEDTLVAMYRRIGLPSRASVPGWETIAAQQIGYQVRRELSAPAITLARTSENLQS
jgi:hypothetical protein